MLKVVHTEGQPRYQVKDKVVLAFQADAPPELQYRVVDRRGGPLLLLTALFAGAVVLLGRWRGLAALAGLALTMLVLLKFILPALLLGENPLAVALVGSSVLMFVALYIAHGFSVRTSIAVIGALGVLDDVTVTQASAVWELRAANPAYSAWQLYRAAVRIGRDHIASTVNTLVLAYAGASLPLLLLFTISGARLTDLITSDVIATEVVRTLVGSIGLVASVPLTTGLAALLVTAPGAARRARPTSPPSPPPGPTPAEPAEPDEYDEWIALLRKTPPREDGREWLG
jgi:uncharacterized membrane protein